MSYQSTCKKCGKKVILEEPESGEEFPLQVEPFNFLFDGEGLLLEIHCNCGGASYEGIFGGDITNEEIELK